MSDHSSAITEARCFYFERQQVVLDAFSCSSLLCAVGGGGRIRSYFTTDREEPAIFLGTEEILDSGVRMSDGETPEE